MKTRPNNCFRPSLEALDARVVPAANYFNGGNPFDNASWSLGRYPSYHDDVVFDGTHTTDDCSLSAIGPFTSVQLVNGYTGTVTHTTDLWLGTLVIEGGVLSPSDADQDVSVTAEFEWTGGTLNGTAHLNTLTITGATTTALLAPAGGGTVNLGSHVTLTNGASAEMREGTINLTNDGTELNINANSAFDVDPGAGLLSSFTSLFTTHIQIKPGASMTLKSEGRFRAAGRLTNEGSVILMPDSQAYFPGVGGIDTAYLQKSGQTLLYGDSLLETEAAKDTKIENGTLATVSDATGDCSAHIQTGSLLITGGHIYINYGAVAHTTFGILTVTGSVVWTGGTYHPVVQDGTTNADLWQVMGTFTVGGTATLAPGAIDAEWIPCTPTSGSTWLLIDTVGGIIQNNAPAWETPNVWAIDPVPGNPVKKWNLKAL